jgi:phosphonopyruvate decarboxylase
VDPARFTALLERHGFDFFAGVPCSLIEGVIATLERHPRLPYVAAVREDVAVGMAGGVWFGGRRPVVLMQNSGLGTSLNALASFSLMYGLPVLLVVTWRGLGGKDAPEHILMGEISPRLLQLLGIPFRVLGQDVDTDVAWAREEMDADLKPVALLVPPGLFPEGDSVPHPQSEGASTAPSEIHSWKGPRGPFQTIPVEDCAGEAGARSVTSMRADDARALIPKISRYEAIRVAVKQLGDEAVIHANGYPSRESRAVEDRPQNFYMIGSMGLAAPIGLGLALAKRERRTVVFDGDGNLLMALGALANVAACAPANLVHCVFDNEVYGSTGNQTSPSRHVRLDRIAAAAGYRSVAAVIEPDDIAAQLRAMLGSEGPHFLLVKVTAAEADVPRIPHTPEALRDRFRAAVLAS